MRPWLMLCLTLAACQSAPAAESPTGSVASASPSASTVPPTSAPPSSSAPQAAPAIDPQGSKASRFDDGLVMGDLAPYGLESGRAPTVPGPSGGSPRPKASGADVAARLARLRARFRDCYNKALSSDPELDGRIVFRIEVNPDGTVKAASVDETQTSESMLRNTDLSGCLLRAIQATDLGPTGKSAPITFSLPLEIRAQRTPEATFRKREGVAHQLESDPESLRRAC